MVSDFLSSPDSLLVINSFPTFSGGFSPWDLPEIFPVSSETGSGSLSPNPGSDGSSKPDSFELDQTISKVDERKRRRMISNRESARRSRMRKQNHLENLRSQANRFKAENRELTNRMRFASHHLNRVRTENSRLRSEIVVLRHKWDHIRQLLLFQRLQQFPALWPSNSVVSEQTTSLMMT